MQCNLLIFIDPFVMKYISNVGTSFGETMIINHQNIHTVSWTKLCQPKDVGEFGLRPTRMVNIFYMMRVGWALCAYRDDLWVQILRTKYECGDGIVPIIDCNRAGFNLWNGICSS